VSFSNRGAMRRSKIRLWVMMVVIVGAAITSATVVMKGRSSEHSRRAMYFAQQEQKTIYRISLEVIGVAHCREGLARIGQDGGDDLKEWKDLLAWWEAEAASDRNRAAIWARLRQMHERAASFPWEVLPAGPPEPSPVELLPPPDLPVLPPPSPDNGSRATSEV
jgi:hypothetical protein